MAKKSYQFKCASIAVPDTAAQIRTTGSSFLYYAYLALTAMGWTLEDTHSGVYGSNTLSATGNCSTGEPFTLGAKIYTIRTTLTPTEGEILRGATAAETLDNIKLAVNRTDPGTNDGVKYKIAAANPDVECTTNTDTTQVFQGRAKGTWANAYVCNESLTNMTMAAANYLGAQTAGVYDQYTFSSQGESGLEPKGYIHIYSDSGNNFYARAYQYWDSGAHTGTRKVAVTVGAYGYVQSGYCETTDECLILGSKDLVYFHGTTTGPCATGTCILLGHVPNRFLTPLTKLDGAHTLSGGTKALTVDSTTGFGAGSYVQIVGSNGEGCDRLQITTIDSATQMTVAALPRNYADNSYIGYPASTFGAQYDWGTGDMFWHPACHYADAGLTVGTTHYNKNNVMIMPTIGDFTLRSILAPTSVFTTALECIGWWDDMIFCCGAATSNDVLMVMDDGSIPPTHTATSGAATTLTDTTHSWTVDALIGKYVVITSGAGNAQVRKILDNDGTSITVDAWYTNPDATSTYKIVDHAYRAINFWISNVTYGAFEIIDCVVPS